MRIRCGFGARRVAGILFPLSILSALPGPVAAQTPLAAAVVTGHSHKGGPGFVVARTAEEFDALKSRIGRNPGSFQPGRMVAVGIFRGKAQDGSYGVRVTRVERSGLILKVTFQDLKPAAGDQTGIKRPYAVVLVRGRFKTVRLSSVPSKTLHTLTEKPVGQVLKYKIVSGRDGLAAEPHRNSFYIQRDRKRWQAYVKGRNDPAFVDGTHTGVILKIGHRPNRSYALEVRRVAKVGDQIIVYYRENRSTNSPVLKVASLLLLLRITGTATDVDFREVR